MQLPDRIMVTEVGPRDGLQNEPEQVPVQDKIRFIDQLSACGFPEIEVTAFVSPRWVPQLSDATEVLSGISRVEGVTYSALVPNMEGWQRAAEAGVDKISVFTAASESFSRRNTNATIAETLARFEPVIHAARESGCPVRAYVSCAVACPFEGVIRPDQVKAVVASLLDRGVTEIDLGDTIGMATPHDIDALVEAVADQVAAEDLVLHLHDTRGTALACCYRALQLGVSRFDTSCGGLGGCPYAPGATGNLATEDLLFLTRGLGIDAGIDASRVNQAASMMERSLDRPLTGRVYRADASSEQS